MGIVNFKKIMVATDDSTCATLAADKGIEFARLNGGTVYAVHVLSNAYLSAMDGESFPSMGMNPWESIKDEFHKKEQKAVDYIKESGKMKGVNVESVLLEGNPSEELIRMLKRKIWILLLWALSERQDWTGFLWVV